MICDIRVRALRTAMVFVTSFFAAGTLASAQTTAEMPPEIPIEVFAQLPQISGPKLSPDGASMALIRPYKGIQHLYIQPTRGKGKKLRLPPEDWYEISWANWATNERLLIGISFPDRRGTTPTTETRLLAMNRDGSDMKDMIQPRKYQRLTTPVGRRIRKMVVQIQDDVVDYLPGEPDHILLSIDSDFDGYYELRRINVNTSRFTEIYRGFRGVQNWMTDQQGNIRFAWGVDTKTMVGGGGTSKRRTRYRHADDSFTDFSESAIYQQGFGAWGFAENPDHAYMRGTGKSGTEIFIKYDLRAEKVIETYENEKHDADRLIYDGLGKLPIGVRFAGGTAPVIFDPDWAKRYHTVNDLLPDTDNVIVSSNSALNLHLVHSSSDVNPGVYYLFDEALGQPSLLRPLYKNLDPAHLAPMRRVSYEARDGLSIPAILTLPVGSDGKNLPTIVLSHGGPHTNDEAAFNYWVQFLANRGYAVLQPNFRGSSGYGKAFLRAGYQQWGLKMQDDVTDGTKWLIEQGIADPARICIIGGSYGGYAAMMGVAKEPGLYACAVSLNGIADIPKFMRDARKYVGGAIHTNQINKKNQVEASPERYAKTFNSPILLIATKDDRNVNYEQSKNMAKALKKAKKAYKYVEMESGDHSLTTEAARATFLRETEAFLAEHIGKGR